jgi:membrane associated rhomboid family serine protease
VRFLLLYLACGAAGSLTHTFLFPGSTVPSIGASGSIAGLLGAFLVLKPHARIVTLFPLVVYWAMAEIPALLFLPVWFGMQFFNGFLSLQAARGTQEIAGIAWWAHVGGFAFGALVAGLFRFTRRQGRIRAT